jgi:glycosyltransferase involved in cell wall biosynthesis
VKILLVHSYYQQKGGEDAVFEQEFEMLKQTQEVRAVTFRNHRGWKGAVQFLISVWNLQAARKLKIQILEFKPDIVQIYNWHFASGPIIVRTAKSQGIHTVINIQNYRLLCPSGTLLYRGKLFTPSIEKRGFPWKAVFKKAYRNSALQTFWLAFVVWIHKQAGTWQKVDQYIVPTQVVKNLFTDSDNYLDIPARKFVVKPNFSVQTGLTPEKRGNHFLFVGRLSEEKGLQVLLDAFKNKPYELVIAGGGPLMDLVSETCSLHSNIKYAGNLNKSSVKEAMSRCTAFIFSSVWYEPFGLVITEALSNGCPLIASDIGSPVELVQEGITGIHFKAGNSESLQMKLYEWQNKTEEVKEQYRQNCISCYDRFYTPEKNREQLLSIYHSLVDH